MLEIMRDKALCYLIDFSFKDNQDLITYFYKTILFAHYYIAPLFFICIIQAKCMINKIFFFYCQYSA